MAIYENKQTKVRIRWDESSRLTSNWVKVDEETGAPETPKTTQEATVAKVSAVEQSVAQALAEDVEEAEKTYDSYTDIVQKADPEESNIARTHEGKAYMYNKKGKWARAQKHDELVETEEVDVDSANTDDDDLNAFIG